MMLKLLSKETKLNWRRLTPFATLAADDVADDVIAHMSGICDEA